MRLAFRMVVPAVIGLAVAACGRPAPTGPPPAPTAQTVNVTGREWAFELSPLQAKAGKITFRVKNEGAVEHNFLIENKPGAQVDGIQPGETKSLTTELTPGDYTVLCNLPGHREAGMTGALKVSR